MFHSLQRGQRNLLSDTSEKSLHIPGATTATGTHQFGLLFSLFFFPSCNVYTHITSSLKKNYFFPLLYLNFLPIVGTKLMKSIKVFLEDYQNMFWRDGGEKKGRCICLCILVLWQSKIFSSLLMKVENRMCCAEQSNPLRTCLMRWRLTNNTVSGLKSQTTCLQEKMQRT